MANKRVQERGKMPKESRLGKVKSSSADHDKHYCFGERLFGPFLYGFVRWLKKELNSKGYDKVFFFSRDGYMMKKAFDLINDGNIESEYVYFSRKSLSQTLLWKCKSYESSLRFLKWERYISIGRLMEYYGFNEKERLELSEKDGFSLEKDISFGDLKNDESAKKLYETYKDRINRHSREQAGLLEAYLVQTGMTGRIAVVDIGWHGTMQYYLDVFAKIRHLNIQMEGFYVGVNPDKKYSIHANGYLFNKKNDRNRKRLLCFFGGYEKLFQSTEGSTDGYRMDNGRVVPALMPYEYEDTKESLKKRRETTADDKHVVEIIEQFHRGALEYVKSALKASEDRKDESLVEPMIRFGMKPSVRDTMIFSDFYNNDGGKIYYVAQKKLFQYGAKELVHAFAKSPWKTGFMKSVFRLPLPYYWVYQLMKR